MNEQPREPWEARLSQWTAEFPYPEVPDIAGAVSAQLSKRVQRSRAYRLAWTAMLLVVVLAGLLAVPPVRAAVLAFLQVGNVRIWLVEPTATPAPTVAPTNPPRPAPALLTSVLDLAGETTLVEAQAQVDFPIRLPAYPPTLGTPARVYLQDLDGQAVVLVWLDAAAEDRVRMSLTILGANTFVEKALVRLIEETTVNGNWAAWLEGEHILRTQDRGYEMSRLVQGNTLVWMDVADGHELTYRLETDLPLEEAVRVAESLE